MICKELTEFNSKRPGYFTTEDIQTAKKHTKICSTSLASREMQIMLQWDVTTHPLESLKWKIMTTPNTEKDAEKLDFAYFAGRNVK